MNHQQLKLENQLCFPLYAASRQIIRLYKPYLDPLKITYTQYLVLLVLWELDNQSVTSIGNKLFLDSGTLTPLLKKLEAHKYIKRTRLKEDERVVMIKLTEKGIDTQVEASKIPAKIAQCISLNHEDVVQLISLLRKITNSNLTCE